MELTLTTRTPAVPLVGVPLGDRLEMELTAIPDQGRHVGDGERVDLVAVPVGLEGRARYP